MNDFKSLDELSKRFPTGFVWGVASSAFQIEGASAADGKGDSIWDDFCRLPGVIADGSDGKIACDHYNRLESDLDLISELGVRGYRFSISWPRIQPTGSGAAVGPGIDFYNRLVDCSSATLNPSRRSTTGTCRRRCSANTTGGPTAAPPTDSRNTPLSSRSGSAIACAHSRHITNRGSRRRSATN
jgi:hypothetical protein